MTTPVFGPALPDPPYKSSWRTTDRDGHGRFLPKFSGAVCDRMGCLDAIEAPGARFCDAHRRAHGQRLLAQLGAVVEHHRTVTVPARRRFLGDPEGQDGAE